MDVIHLSERIYWRGENQFWRLSILAIQMESVLAETN